jgi:hypothetical protein
VDNFPITTPRALAEFLVDNTNLSEAPEGLIMVIDIDQDSHEITKIGHTGDREVNANLVLQFCEESIDQNEGRVILVPTDWVKNGHTKDILSTLKGHNQVLDVLAIDCERRVFYSALCNDTDCCPADGTPIDSRG